MSLPCVGDVYETNLPNQLVLWCVDIRSYPFGNTLAYDFIIVDGQDPHSCNLWRTWTTNRFRGLYDECFDIETVMKVFNFKKIT
jgi:hypothetical protein